MKNYIAEMFDVFVDEKAIENSIRKLKKEYSEEVIQETLSRCYDNIKGFLVKGAFSNDAHKVNAGMKIIQNNIKNVSDELIKKSQLKQKQERDIDVMNSMELIPYICQMFELENISEMFLERIDILKSKFDEESIKEEFFKYSDSILSHFEFDNINDSDERLKTIYNYVDDIHMALDIEKSKTSEWDYMGKNGMI